MAQYVAFEKTVEVNGQTILASVNAFPEYMRSIGIKLLETNGIVSPTRDKWFNQQAWLDTFKEIGSKFGSNTLIEIGKNIPNAADFPSEIKNLETALKSIDVAYHMNHRKGDIGFYKLISFELSAKKAIMECKNPYPCFFDKGIIISMSRKFIPNGATQIDVNLDKTKKSRIDGADSSTYIISWC